MDRKVAQELVGELERAWNAGDGAGFARPFAEDADFVNIRGEYHRTREAIARGHQAIFDTIYKGSHLRCEVTSARSIAPGVALAHSRNMLRAPAGPLAGEHRSQATLVLVEDAGNWRIAAFHNTLIA